MQAILNCASRVLQIAATMLALVGLASTARADIYQWEYINLADPSQGKQKSTTLAPDGAGVDAVPGADLSSRNLTMAYLIGGNLTGASGDFANLTDTDLSQANLTNAGFAGATLTGANLREANLTNARLYWATLTSADFTGAEIRGASFGGGLCFFGCSPIGTGLTLAQLYSTSSYQAGDLSGIYLGYNDLVGGNFAGQNLISAEFGRANLRGANFRDANLTDGQFYNADLTGANFREANVASADFGSDCDTGNLNSYCPSTIAKIAGADFTAADARGARVFLLESAITTNLIRSDGHIRGLDLDSGGRLVVRDYDGEPMRDPAPLAPIPITVDQHLAIGPGGTLRMVFEADAWDSTISFAPGTSVTLGGVLELTFAADVTLASQVGRTFGVFDWTGANPTGAFAVFSPYAWDLSHLYTTGEVTLTAIPEPNALVLICLTLCVLVPYRNSNRLHKLAAMLSLVAFASQANADIYQWEYINPADPSQGRRQSTTLAPDGAGVDAVAGANLSFRDLTMARLIGADLTGADVGGAILTNADLSGATLSSAYLDSTTLTNTDFTGAKVNGTRLGSGFTAAQLYSTASYQDRDLSDIGLSSNDLNSWNFTGQNLTGAYFFGATLTGADFTGAQVQGADFSRGGSGIGVTLAQLYSTASYLMYDLSGIDLEFNDLHGGNFARQNLRNADFGAANLSGANFREANLVNANFTGSACLMYPLCVPIRATLTNVDLTEADVRGSFGLDDANLSGVTIANLIWSDGHINGLDLDAGALLIVRDYDGDPSDYYGNPVPPIAITVDQHLAMGPGGKLRIVFEADAWESTISFARGIPVTLGGTLELTLVDDVNLASQVGRTFDLFDWTGINPAGAFAVSSPYAWDLSRLYTTGEVTLTAVSEPCTFFLFSFVLTPLVAMGRVRPFPISAKRENK